MVLETILVAFAMFSAIPLPRVDWNGRNMRYALCAFPLVGAVCGGLWWGWAWVCGWLGAPELLRGAGFCLIPALVTGGIHLDGYCDTVDALASRSLDRLCRTVQLSDTGVIPGSGVGNHRRPLNRETLGVPVVTVGVPTVVDAATIVHDTMENLILALESSETLRGVGVVMQGYNAAEKYELVKELISPHLNGLFVTPKDIDETVKRISYTISEALNMLFSRGHAHNQEMGVI